MNTKLIKHQNDSEFLKDIKRCRDVVTLIPRSNFFVRINKNEVIKKAEWSRVFYTIRRDIFVVERDTMVIY